MALGLSQDKFKTLTSLIFRTYVDMVVQCKMDKNWNQKIELSG